MTSKKELEKAFDKACNEIAKDVPVLLHAVGATSVDPDAVAMVSALTVQYMTKLVDAALESRDNQFADTLPPPPPPAKKSNEKKRKAAPFDRPLPEPKVRKPETKLAAKDSVSWCEQEDSLQPPPSMMDWVGIRGVDLWEDRRLPPTPGNLSAHHALFSLCHDTFLYGRIRQALNTKKDELIPRLTDPGIQEIVREEAALLKEQEREKKKKPKEKEVKKNADNSDGEEDEEDEKEEEEPMVTDENPSWPILDGLLPVILSAEHDK